MEKTRWTREEWEYANRLLHQRQEGRCAWCGENLRQVERHHRQRRAVGGDGYHQILLLCRNCHHWVTEHPLQARDRGISVSSYAADPARIPVTLADGQKMRLDRYGGWIRVGHTSEQP